MLEKVLEYKKKIIITGIGLIIVLLLISKMFINKPKEVVSVDESLIMNEEIEEEKEEIKEDLVTVDIKGSVINPGVYTLTKGSRVIDVVNIAGGYSENANTSLINLSKLLKDEMVVFIYDNNLVEKILEENKERSEVEKLIIEPNDINEANIDKNNTSISNNQSTEEQSSKVNINTASLEELMTLTGIGESKAKSIIEYRDNSSFVSIEDIMNVSGIGEAGFEKIKDNITI